MGDIPVDKQLLSVGEMFCIRGGGRRQCLLAFAVLALCLDIGGEDLRLHVDTAPASSHPVVEEEDCHIFVVINFCILFFKFGCLQLKL